MATEERTGKTDLPSLALSLLLMNIWVMQRQWYSFSYAKGLAAAFGEDRSLCSLHTVMYLQNTQTFPCFLFCPNLPLSITHTETEGYVWILKIEGLISSLLSIIWDPSRNADKIYDWLRKNEMQWMQGYQTVTPHHLPQRNSGGAQVTVSCAHPLWLRSQSSSSQSCRSEPLVQWRTHSSPSTV